MLTPDVADQTIWEGIRQGNEALFAQAFNRYHATLYNYGCKLCSDSAQVEDAVQDIFIDIWRLRANLTQNLGSLKFYLYRSLHRRLHVSQNRKAITQDLLTLPAQDTPFIPDDAETRLIEHETKTYITSYLEGILSKLPQRQVEAITLRYFDEFSFAETAQIMGVSEKTVRNFIYRAFVSLRKSSKDTLRSTLNICTVFVSILVVNWIVNLAAACELYALY